ncbi:MAG: tRNA (N6-threonylcarbamoyladenosine(37)-N6)-methyltransferase TrmO [Acidobacteria bacterium]|nr:tRNA (N6-threonylcarbamoyladenosine(37)-N6)-methyltransferase TrmO [Acidobacteriota bacterium]
MSAANQGCGAVDNTLRFIGVVRSPVQERKQMPAFGVPAAVELNPAFEPGLLRIGKHSHFWVLVWLNVRPERDVLQVTPHGVQADAPDSLHGVFAVRSPARPNPIGLTAAQLVRRDRLVLHFDALDFLDGTPVLDLKPYFVTRDMVFSANHAIIGRIEDRAALRESLLHQALQYCAARHPDVARAVRIVEHYRAEALNLTAPSSWEIEAPLARPYLVDALIGMTRVSLSRGLRLEQKDIVRLNGAEYRLKPGAADWDSVWTQPLADMIDAVMPA